SPSSSPEIHVRGPIQDLVINGDHSGEVTVAGITFVVTSTTELEDAADNHVTLNEFNVGDSVDAWGPSPTDNRTHAKKIRKR
ncbi:MAG: DUF5666 domain-containing protein, partial [bacterium]